MSVSELSGDRLIDDRYRSDWQYRSMQSVGAYAKTTKKTRVSVSHCSFVFVVLSMRTAHNLLLTGIQSRGTDSAPPLSTIPAVARPALSESASPENRRKKAFRMLDNWELIVSTDDESYYLVSERQHISNLWFLQIPMILQPVGQTVTGFWHWNERHMKSCRGRRKFDDPVHLSRESRDCTFGNWRYLLFVTNVVDIVDEYELELACDSSSWGEWCLHNKGISRSSRWVRYSPVVQDEEEGRLGAPPIVFDWL